MLTSLPQDKDYAGVLYAVKSASSKTGVGIGDFLFTVGELSAKNLVQKSLPTLALKLNLVGTPDKISAFLTELAKTLPLSNVTDVTINTKSADVRVEFYYKPISQLRVNYTQPVIEVSPINITLLDHLHSWRLSQAIFDNTGQLTERPASASASPFGF